MISNIPTSRKEVTNRINSDLTANLSDSGSFLPTSYLGSLATAFGFRIYDVYQKILIMIAQFFINTANDENVIRWGDTYGVTRNAATNSTGNIVFTGTATTVIPAVTTLQSSSGIQYTTQASGAISTQVLTASSVSRVGTTVTVNFATEHNLASGVIIDSVTGASPSDFNTTNAKITVTSSKQFQYTLAGTSGSASGTISIQVTFVNVPVKSSSQGTATNIGAGGVLTLSSTISGVDNNAYVDINEISGGSDIESASSYRARVLNKIQFPFSFFNKNSLISQAKKVTGVTRVWVFSPDTTSSSLNITSLTRSGNIAIAEIASHGLVDGNYITVNGATQSEYNVVEQRIIVIDSDNIAYPVSGTPASPATGTITCSYSYVEPGQVRIGFVKDNNDPIIPTSTEVNIVKTKLLEIKPAHTTSTDLIVFSPTAISIDVTFSTLSPNSTIMQTAITNSLKGFFKSSNNIGVNVKLDDIKAIINQTIDSAGNTPTYTLSAPSIDTTIGLNEIGTLGTITFP